MVPNVNDPPSGDIGHRLDRLDNHVTRQGEMISSIIKEAVNVELRVRTLETYAQTRAVTEAREDERDKALMVQLGRMEKDIESIKGLGSKALWVVGSAVLLAFVTFILNGGLKGLAA